MPRQATNQAKTLAPPNEILPSYLVIDTEDVDEAADFTRRALSDHRVEPKKTRGRFHLRVHHARLATASVVYVDSHSWLAVVSPPQRVFRVFVGVEGTVEHVRGGGETFYSAPGSAAIHSHDTEFRVETTPSRSLIVTIPEALVVREASPREGRDLGTVSFEPRLDLSSSGGGAFYRFVLFVASELEQPGGLRPDSRPMEQIEKALVELLLDAQPHIVNGNGRRRLDAGPAVVRRVDELIHAGLDLPLTVGELASHAGVSARTLFRTYRRYRGRSPIRALREARLTRARAELLDAESGTTVTQTAIQCGFTHLGRFSEFYRRAYGETPSATLRRSRSMPTAVTRASPAATASRYDFATL